MRQSQSDIKINHKIINKAEIARQLGVSRAYVSFLLRGKRKNEQLLKKILEIVKNVEKQY
jgi:transcriptional regulator with XRE-family HTH domain